MCFTIFIDLREDIPDLGIGEGNLIRLSTLRSESTYRFPFLPFFKIKTVVSVIKLVCIIFVFIELIADFLKRIQVGSWNWRKTRGIQKEYSLTIGKIRSVLAHTYVRRLQPELRLIPSSIKDCFVNGNQITFNYRYIRGFLWIAHDFFYRIRWQSVVKDLLPIGKIVGITDSFQIGSLDFYLMPFVIHRMEIQVFSIVKHPVRFPSFRIAIGKFSDGLHNRTYRILFDISDK